MAVAGPYGIEQFDAPGIIGAYQTGQRNRLELMAAQKQLDREDKLTRIYGLGRVPRGTGAAGAIGAYAPPATDQPNTAAPNPKPHVPGIAATQDERSSTTTIAPGPSPAAAAVDPGATGSAAPAANAPLPETWLQANEPMLREMVAVSPKEAFTIAGSLRQMDEAQLKQASSVNTEVSRAALYLRSIPQADRPAELKRITPVLVQAGIKPEQISAADLSDNGLNWLALQGRDVDKILSTERADRNTQSLVDTREARVDEYGRHNLATEGNTVRGQNLAHGDRMSGQLTTRRGQDLTHGDRQAAIVQSNTNNVRSTGTSRDNSVRSTDTRLRTARHVRAGGVSANEPVAHGPNGQTLVVRNGQWVDANTGKPVQ